MTETGLPLMIAVAGAGAFGCVAVVLYEWCFRYHAEVGDRLKSDFGRAPNRSAEQINLFKDLGKLARDADPEAETLVARLDRLIEQAGLTFTPRQLIAACAVSGVVVCLLAAVATQWWVAAAIGFVLAVPAPLLFVAIQRERRLNRLRLQLPDAFEMMSRTIRAGQTVSRAFQTVADDFEGPIADEFAWCAEQQNLGLPQDVALQELARRSGVSELQMLVVALLVQRQSGGSPVEMLDNLAAVVRKRIELQGRIKTLTAEGRMQAAILLLLPPLLLGVITLLNPEYVDKLWDRPLLLAGILTSEVIGVLWIRQILKLEF
jgi:tight adherence protein B